MKCANCGRLNAVEYGISGRQVLLCTACRRRLELQDQFDQAAFAKLLFKNDYEGALKFLSDAESRFGHLDIDGWLRRTILVARALVLQEQGNWAEALRATEERLSLDFEEPSELAGAYLSAGILMRRLGRFDEARAHANSALDVVAAAHPQAILPRALKWLGEGDESVFVGRGELIASALRAFNLQSPVDPMSDPVGALRWAGQNWNPS